MPSLKSTALRSPAGTQCRRTTPEQVLSGDNVIPSHSALEETGHQNLWVCVSLPPGAHCLNLGSKWMLKTLYPAWYWCLCVTEGDIWSYHTRQKDECDPRPHGTWSGDLRVSPFPLALFYACIYESHPFKCCPFTL